MVESFTFAGDPVSASGEDGFQSGIKLYQEQKYDEAGQKFKKEFLDGKDFAALHYNWGLASYKLKKRGLAVGLWRRALFIDPDFRPAAQALEFSSQELPRDMTDSLSTWSLFRSRILDRASLNKFLVLSWIFLALGGFLTIRYLAARRVSLRQELPMPRAPTVGIALITGLFIFVALSAGKFISLFEIHATVIDATASLRTGPSLEDNAIFDILEGFDVIIETVHSGWAQVTLTSGQSGWVKTDALFQHTGKLRLW